MALPRLAASPVFLSVVGAHSFVLAQAAYHYRPQFSRRAQAPAKRTFSSTTTRQDRPDGPPPTKRQRDEHSEAYSTPSTATGSSTDLSTADSTSSHASNQTLPPGWDDDPDYNISHFSQLPHRLFGANQHIKVNEDFKESLRQILWQFRAPIRYAFAYGSGVFSQKTIGTPDSGGGINLSPHPHPPKAVEEWQKGGAKIVDFIFGVSYTQHWHSLNLAEHPEHYSGLKYLPFASASISRIQDKLGAGVYFNPYITVNGTMIKYGVVNLDTLCTDLFDWSTLYIAGRLQKPVKILRDDPRVRLANQVNLISAVRTALLTLPAAFTERALYERIAGLSYTGDPRMIRAFGGENPRKISNIVGAQLPGFRQLYVPLIENLPNVSFADARTPPHPGWEKDDVAATPADVLGGPDGLNLQQDLDPQRRGNMVRRLPPRFRQKLYAAFQQRYHLPGGAYADLLHAARDEDGAGAFARRDGGAFDRRIAADEHLASVVEKCVEQTVKWPATVQSVKALCTAGLSRSWRYYAEKREKNREGVAQASKPADNPPAEKKRIGQD